MANNGLSDPGGVHFGRLKKCGPKIFLFTFSGQFDKYYWHQSREALMQINFYTFMVTPFEEIATNNTTLFWLVLRLTVLELCKIE